MSAPDNYDTIAAIATPLGNAGIGIIRISGPGAIEIARQVFDSAQFGAPPPIPRHLYHGRIRDPLDGTLLDEVLLACMPGPHSYTGEDVVEINCHGGLTVMRAVFERVLRQGARIAAPGEFTRRAFLNGRLDLAQAEAVIDLIESRSNAGMAIAARQMTGALSDAVARIRNALIELRAHLEACIDFPEDDVDTLTQDRAAAVLREQRKHLASMIARSQHAERYCTGIDAVIAGKPNVGKSSIMNVLLGDERSIVTSIPGTTRDVIRETVTIADIPVRLHDTAGIHTSTDAVETLGMDRALGHLETADIALLVFDGSRPLDNHDNMVLAKKNPLNSIALINKADLPQELDPADLSAFFEHELIVTLSAKDHRGFDTLRERIAGLLQRDTATSLDEILITRLRHKQALEAALGSLRQACESLDAGGSFELISMDVHEALHSLGEITGETTAGDILDAIFSRFCIGK